MADWFRLLKWRMRVAQALREVETRRVTARPHGLDTPLIVSLTSFPLRFPTLLPTLKGLMRQSMAPDRVQLWIAEEDMAALPAEVRALAAEGLEILPCTDLRSYKKIVPALRAHPDATIVTADDDLYYGPDWLAGLVDAARRHPDDVIGHRAHRIAYGPDGRMLSYELWKKNIAGEVSGPDIFATGVGGVLYPPGCLHPDVTREDLFRTLCPHADDIWLYWMARRQGAEIRHVGPRTRIVEWPGSQESNLRAINRGAPGETGNDRAIAAMTAHFGPPPR